MTIQRNRLTQIEFFKVGKLLENMAIDGHINLYVGDLKKIVKAELDIDVCSATLKNSAEAAGVEIRRNKKSNGDMQFFIDPDRIALLEKKVEHIAAQLGIGGDWVDLFE